MIKRVRGKIRGIVQGVGFRPFIYQLASRYGLSGFVINTSDGVTLEIEGADGHIDSFFKDIIRDCPPLAYISSIEREYISPKYEKGFQIEESKRGDERSTLISPDVCVCEDCIREMMDPFDRRYRYPFINCTNCGPRYTIIMDIPYDRENTTMKKFKMCKLCKEEYEDPQNRRFHAQPNACPKCGPEVTLWNNKREKLNCDDPILKAKELIKKGAILAIKGLGGFHLAVDAKNHKAVVRLRKRKRREEKPFAIMVRDIEDAKGIAHLSHEEEKILTSKERPIVLLRKRKGNPLSSEVSPKNRYFGIMLPYTPIHYLLLEKRGDIFVMTSGNITDEPINIDNDDAFRNLKDIADYFLIHNRDIYLRSDDSVVTFMGGKLRQIRRSRGYVPVPIFLSERLRGLPLVLALGGELKNTICLIKDGKAFLSQHVGDMENLETFQFFLLTIRHMSRILDITPELLVYDMHPDYLTTQYAKEQTDIPTVAVQHHHAHLVSCLAENGISGPVIGITLDGTGYGTDGNIWGGEVLVGDALRFRRRAHFEYVPLPGGDSAIRYPWKSAISYLYKAFESDLLNLNIPLFKRISKRDTEVVLKMIQRDINCYPTSSCGRLFDAIAAILGLRHRVSYEGQAPMELEMISDEDIKDHYEFGLEKEGDRYLIKISDLIRAVVEDVQKGIGPSVIAKRFHNSIIEIFKLLCVILRDEEGINRVALSGGVFQNRIIFENLSLKLQQEGFEVITHSLVPTNDGGLSLGQAIVGGLRFKEGLI